MLTQPLAITILLYCLHSLFNMTKCEVLPACCMVLRIELVLFVYFWQQVVSFGRLEIREIRWTADSGQLCGNSSRGENEIYTACCDGVAGHSIILGRFFIL